MVLDMTLLSSRVFATTMVIFLCTAHVTSTQSSTLSQSSHMTYYPDVATDGMMWSLDFLVHYNSTTTGQPYIAGATKTQYDTVECIVIAGFVFSGSCSQFGSPLVSLYPNISSCVASENESYTFWQTITFNTSLYTTDVPGTTGARFGCREHWYSRLQSPQQEMPNSEPFGFEPFISPIVPNTPQPSFLCDNSTMPSGGSFICSDDGHWVLNATESTTSVTIPSGHIQTVVIQGNVTNLSSITILSIGSVVHFASQCPTSLANISVVLDSSTIATLIRNGSLSFEMISFPNGSTCGDQVGRAISVDLIQSASDVGSCNTASVDKKLVEGKLVGIITLQRQTSGSCSHQARSNRTILIVSIVVPLAVFAVALLIVLMAVFYKPCRVAIRPYSEASNNRARV